VGVEAPFSLAALREAPGKAFYVILRSGLNESPWDLLGPGPGSGYSPPCDYELVLLLWHFKMIVMVTIVE